jgi:hypothetical protein
MKTLDLDAEGIYLMDCCNNISKEFEIAVEKGLFIEPRRAGEKE